jgi:HJR/Mrr/RecB family endonuclease
MEKFILCVDDNPLLISEERASLGEIPGHQVLVASTNDKALDLLRRYGDRVKLVIQDMTRPPGKCLPSRDLVLVPAAGAQRLAANAGLVFFDRYLAEEAGDRPCIFHTSWVDPDIAEQINCRPGAHYLPRSDSYDELLMVVRVLLEPKGNVDNEGLSPSPVVIADATLVNAELLARLAHNPDDIYGLAPRTFEKLVARLFEDLGYEVELTPEKGDGGLDVRAIRKDEAGPLLYIVECKRYGPEKRVDVGIARSVYGVKVATGANVAVLATTSFFTKGAKDFQRAVGFGLSLKDFSDLKAWLGKYRTAET